MAIISNIQTEYGLQATYSKITAYHESFDSVTVTLSSYLSAEDRQAGRKPISVRSYSVSKDTEGFINQEGMNHIRYAYIKLIQAYGFEGDEDVSAYITEEADHQEEENTEGGDQNVPIQNQP